MSRLAREALSLYLVTDAALCGDRGVVETVRQALAGGVRLIQLRDKQASDAELVELARALLDAAEPYGAKLVVNDRVEAARAAGCHGAHIGQTDGDPLAARGLLGPGAILGLSVETEDQARLADPALVDYVGVSPVWGTATKPDHAPPLGFDGAVRARRAARCPAVAIGGIGPGRAGRLIAAGFDGVAVVSAICAAAEPEAAARALAQEIASARKAVEAAE